MDVTKELWVKDVIPGCTAQLNMLPLRWRPGLLRRIYALSLILGSRNNPRTSELVHKSVFTDILSVVPARDKLRLKSLDLWLSAIPFEALGLAIPSFEFSLLLCWWLGERLLSAPSYPY